jgi:hypothetical protein
MLSAISEAAAWNKQAIKDVNKFYQTYVKTKADFEAKRSWVTDLTSPFKWTIQSHIKIIVVAYSNIY